MSPIGREMKETIEARKEGGSFLDRYPGLNVEPDMNSPEQKESRRLAALLIPVMVNSVRRARRLEIKYDVARLERLLDAVRYHALSEMYRSGEPIPPEEKTQLKQYLSMATHALDYFFGGSDKSKETIAGLLNVLDNLARFSSYLKLEILEGGEDVLGLIFGPALLGEKYHSPPAVCPKCGEALDGNRQP